MPSTPSIFDVLGLDANDLAWEDLALCKDMAPTNHQNKKDLFFDGYESSTSTARMVDDICLSCPVMKQCLLDGMDRNASGVRGGIYLIDGNVDAKKNLHKTEEVWTKIRERIGNSV